MIIKPPHCRNPHHPPDASRDSMALLREHRGTGPTGPVTHHVWICRACMERRRLESIQVITSPEYKSYIASLPEVRRAKDVRRDRLGKITYFR